uniref:G domain-containing protein n=1 Tax=Romanomermis culicivorax TaxID=13658 RepID=A0A915KNF4_ROMCU
MKRFFLSVNPTTKNFVIVSHGPKLRVLDGRMLVSSTDPNQPPPQNNFDQFGGKFLEHLYKIEMPKTLLQNLTFVDTPGFIEHKKLPERGYPFKEAIKWWARRADLILVIFDPTKLDVGSEMDALFSCLKGKESM